MPNNNIIIVTGDTQLDPVNGSLLLNFNELVNDRGIDYVILRVNGSARYIRYSDTERLYTTNLNLGDIVSIQVYTNPSNLGKQISIIRRDYTTDDQNGDDGIRDTFITSSGGTSNPLSLVFTATTVSDAYNFEYIVNCSSFTPPPTPECTISGGTASNFNITSPATIQMQYVGSYLSGSGTNLASDMNVWFSGLTGISTVTYNFPSYNFGSDFTGTSITQVIDVCYYGAPVQMFTSRSLKKTQNVTTYNWASAVAFFINGVLIDNPSILPAHPNYNQTVYQEVQFSNLGGIIIKPGDVVLVKWLDGFRLP